MSAAIATQIDVDPVAAKIAVGEVRQQSTAVLRDLRSLVGLLRDDDEQAGPSDVRTETLTGISGLMAEVSEAGRAVELPVLGPDDGRSLGARIGPLAQLTAYRMVQESLTNAGRHAAGTRSEVEVDDRHPDRLVITVFNAPQPQAPPSARQPRAPHPVGGLGLVGRRERADLTGSQLSAGPTADGGWQVRLAIPRADP